MFGPALAVLPLSAFFIAAVVVGVVVLVRRVPSHELTAPVVRARRRGFAVAAVGLTLAVALLVLGTSMPQTSLRRTQLIAVVPLAAAALHAAVLLVGELSWPRPAQRIRSARLAVRSVRQDAPRGMVTLFAISCVLTWVVCAVGTVMADDTGRALEFSAPPMTSSASPFPGAFYSGPIALAGVLVVALTWTVLLRVPRRPAVPGADAATDGTLRRAAAHRALRVSTSALLGTTAALVFFGGTAAHGIGGSWGEEVAGVFVRHDAGPGPVWDAIAAGIAISGFLLALAALAVLLVPARGVRR
ncbi:hypothetical protein [Kineococcus sp. R86509]|uniref:hypothetical protein n=1 Tax=Kineococcus sp. R86509 TaxID=3093851 RepID=UPI0036D421D0